MLSRILFLCLFAALWSAGSSLRCRWMDNNFRGCSNASIYLINSMATYTDDISDDAKDNTVDFPKKLYNAVYMASDEEKLSFTVQVLEEVAVLFEEDLSSASWENVTVQNFRFTVTRQVEGLGKCIRNHRPLRDLNIKLRAYFKKLSCHILQPMGHSAKAWELVRSEIQTHLLRLDLLISSLLTSRT